MIELKLITDYFNFILVGILMVIIIGILLSFYCHNKKISRNKMKLYGIMMNMNNKHILAISITLINYLFLICGLLFYEKVNVLFISITLILSLIPCFLAYNSKYLLFSVITAFLNCGIVFIDNQIHFNYLKNGGTDILIISYLITLVGFVYFTITEFISINYIVNAHNLLRRKGNEKKIK